MPSVQPSIHKLFMDTLAGKNGASENLEQKIKDTTREKDIKRLKKDVDGLRTIIEQYPKQLDIPGNEGIAITMNAIYKGLLGRADVPKENLPTREKVKKIDIGVFMPKVTSTLDQLAHDLRSRNIRH